jgi:hypothetical protein
MNRLSYDFCGLRARKRALEIEIVKVQGPMYFCSFSVDLEPKPYKIFSSVSNLEPRP